MENSALTFNEKHVLYLHDNMQIRFETYLRKSKKTLFEMVLVIPERIYAEGKGFLSSAEARSVIQGLKSQLSVCFKENVTLEYKNSLSLGLLEKISNLFSDYKPKDTASNNDSLEIRRSFRGFELQKDNATVINKALGIEIQLKVGLSGSSLYYKKAPYSLTMQAGADILGEVLYANTIYIETPYRWDPPRHNEAISNSELETIKQNIKSAMELFDSLVFFKEVERANQEDKDKFVLRQIEILNERRLKTGSKN